MSETIEALRRLLKRRLQEVEGEAEKLQRALDSMGIQPRRRASMSSRGRSARRGRPRTRAKRGQRREQLLAAIEANPGARPTELAGALGIAPGQASGLISKARAEKLIVKKGAGYALKQ